jgi:hypothetical protein
MVSRPYSSINCRSRLPRSLPSPSTKQSSTPVSAGNTVSPRVLCPVHDLTPVRVATEEFDELCFQFGIELDEDTTEQVEAAKKSGKKLEEGETEAQLKIEIPANR